MAVKKSLLDEIPEIGDTQKASSGSSSLLSEIPELDADAAEPAAPEFLGPVSPEATLPGNDVNERGEAVSRKPGTPARRQPMTVVTQKGSPEQAQASLEHLRTTLNKYMGPKAGLNPPVAPAATYNVLTELAGKGIDALVESGAELNPELRPMTADDINQARETARTEVSASKDFLRSFMNDYRDEMGTMMVFNDQPLSQRPTTNPAQPVPDLFNLGKPGPAVQAQQRPGTPQPHFAVPLSQHMDEVSVVRQDNYINRLFDTNGDTKPMTSFVTHAREMLDKKEQTELADLMARHSKNYSGRGDINAALSRMDNVPEFFAQRKAMVEKYADLRDNLNSAAKSIASLKAVNRRIAEYGNARLDKLDPLEIGMEIAGQLGNGKAVERDIQKIKRGKEIDPEDKVQYMLEGYKGMQYAMVDQFAKGDAKLVQGLGERVQNYQKKVLAANPEFERNQRLRALSSQIYQNQNPIVSSIYDQEITPGDIEAAAKQLGWDPNDVADIHPDDIANPKVWYKRAAGEFLGTTSAGLYKLLVRGAGKVNDQMGGATDWERVNDYLDQDWYENNDTPLIGGKTLLGRSPEGSNAFLDPTRVNTDPSSPEFLMTEANPNGGKFNWDFRGIMNQVGQGVGMLAGLATAAEATGGVYATARIGSLGAADAAALLGDAEAMAGVASGANKFGLTASTFLTMSSDNYSESLRVLGDDPADETKRNLYTIFKTASTALAMQVLPHTKAGQEFLGLGTAPGRELAEYVARNGNEAMDRTFATGIVRRALANGFKDYGKAISIGNIDHMGGMITDAVLAPEKYAQTDYLEEQKQAFITGAITMALPTVFGNASTIRRESKVKKAMMWEVGHNPEPVLDDILAKLDAGEITRDEANSKIQTVRTMENIVDNHVPVLNPITGIRLTPDQRMEYGHNLLQQSLLEAQGKGLTDEVVKKALDTRISNLKSDRQVIMDNAGTRTERKAWKAEQEPAAPRGPEPTPEAAAERSRVTEDNPLGLEEETIETEIDAESNKPAEQESGSGGGVGERGPVEGSEPELAEEATSLAGADRSDSDISGEGGEEAVEAQGGEEVAQEPAAPWQRGDDLKGLGKGMGNSITGGIYEDLFNHIKNGEDNAIGRSEKKLVALARPAIERGDVTTPEQLREFINDPARREAAAQPAAEGGDANVIDAPGSVYQEMKSRYEGDNLSDYGKSQRDLLQKDPVAFFEQQIETARMNAEGAKKFDTPEAVAGYETMAARMEVEKSRIQKIQERDSRDAQRSAEPAAESGGTPSPAAEDVIPSRTDPATPSGIPMADRVAEINARRAAEIDRIIRDSYDYRGYEQSYNEALKLTGFDAKETVERAKEKMDNAYNWLQEKNIKIPEINKRYDAEIARLSETPVKADAEATPREAALPTVEASERADVIEQETLRDGEAERRRAEGSYERDGVTYTRNEDQGTPTGAQGAIQFAAGVDIPFTYQLMEADQVQPAHMFGRRNPRFFIPEAQPKSRTDNASRMASDAIGVNPDLGKAGAAPNAYTGAPVTNSRGEVIQGNNRSEGLKKHYEQNGSSYKQQLADNAEQFGFSREQVESMDKPVLVRRVAAADDLAIQLGNFDVKDIETGGKRRLDPVTTSRRIPWAEKRQILDALIKDGEDKTINQALRERFGAVVGLLKKHLNPAQIDALINKSSGQLTSDGLQDLERVVSHFLFDQGDVNIPDLFEDLPATAKAGLLRAFPKIFSVTPENSLVPEIQNAIIAKSVHATSGVENFDTWAAQADMFNGGRAPRDFYTPLEMAIARQLGTAKKQKEIQSLFAQYAEAVNGKSGDMFGGAVPGMAKAEAVEAVFKVPYEQKTIEAERGDAVAPGEGSDSTTPVERETNDADAAAAPLAVEPVSGSAEAAASTRPEDPDQRADGAAAGHVGEPTPEAVDINPAAQLEAVDGAMNEQERAFVEQSPEARNRIEEADQAVDDLQLSAEQSEALSRLAEAAIDENGQIKAEVLDRVLDVVDPDATPEQQVRELTDHLLSETDGNESSSRTEGAERAEPAAGVSENADPENNPAAGNEGEVRPGQSGGAGSGTQGSQGQPRIARPALTGDPLKDAINERNYYQQVVDAKERRLELMEEHREHGSPEYQKEMQALDAMHKKLVAADANQKKLERGKKLDAAKSTADALRDRKIKNDGLALTTPVQIPIALYNAAVETVALAIEGGAYIRDAIQAGVDYIQKRNFTGWNEAKFRQLMGDGTAVPMTADEIRGRKEEMIKLSVANQRIATGLLDDIRANRKTLREVINDIMGSRGVSEATRRKLADYVKEYAIAEIYKAEGNEWADRHLSVNGGDHALAMSDLADEVSVALKGATSEAERENIKRKYAAARTEIEMDQYAKGVEDGSIVPKTSKEAYGEKAGFDFTLPDRRRKDRVQENWQDVLARLQTAQNNSRKDITQDLDAVTALRLQRGKAHYLVNEVQQYLGSNEYVKGSFFDRAKKAGVDVRRLGLMLYAEHAPERNAYNARIRQELADKEVGRLNDAIQMETDPAKAAKMEATKQEILAGKDPNYPLMPDGGSGMSNQQAADILQEMRDTGDYDKYKLFGAEFRDNVINKILDYKLDSGHIDRDKYNHLKQFYDNYVPLKIDMDREEEISKDRRTFYSAEAKGKDLYRSKGAVDRTFDERNNPLLQSIVDLETSINANVRNKAHVRVANLARANPNPAIWNVVDANIEKTYDAGGNVIKGEEKTKPQFAIPFYENGQKKYVVLHDRGLQQLVKEVGDGPAMKLMYMPTRILTAVNTLANPDFLIKNPFIDLGDAHLTLMGLDNKAIEANYRKYMLRAPKLVGEMLAGKENSEWNKWVDEWKKAGGAITFTRQLGLNETSEKTLKLFDSYDNPLSKAHIKHATRQLENLTSALEQMTRVLVYRSAREAGESMEKSAMISRNATVDFERKGAYGPYLNAFKAFANAGVQGLTNLTYSFMKSARVRKFLGFMVMSGIAEAAMNDQLSDCGANGTKADCWWQIPEYRKQRNFTIWTGPDRTPLSIPLPRQFAWFNYFGKNIYAAARGQQDAAEFMARTLGSLTDFYNPAGGSSPLVQQALGNFGFAAAIYGNENSFGGAIQPEGSDKPASENFWKNVPAPYVKASEFLNELGGGNPGREGTVLGVKTSISPNVLEYLVQTVGGGVYGTIKNTAEGIQKAGTDEEWKNKHIPIVRNFSSESDMAITKERYYKLLKLAEKNVLSEEEMEKLQEYQDALIEGDQMEEDAASATNRYLKNSQKRKERRVRELEEGDDEEGDSAE